MTRRGSRSAALQQGVGHIGTWRAPWPGVPPAESNAPVPSTCRHANWPLWPLPTSSKPWADLAWPREASLAMRSGPKPLHIRPKTTHYRIVIAIALRATAVATSAHLRSALPCNLAAHLVQHSNGNGGSPGQCGSADPAAPPRVPAVRLQVRTAAGAQARHGGASHKGEPMQVH